MFYFSWSSHATSWYIRSNAHRLAGPASVRDECHSALSLLSAALSSA